MSLCVAVVGSGPSAFYAAARLLGASAAVHVDMYERLPTPHGLVRWGVAPDHPDVKNVEHRFAEVAKDPRFRFFGNVNVVAARDAASTSAQQLDYPHALPLPLASLKQHYSALLLAYGSTLARPLGVPGAAPGELQGVHSSLDFVHWYNGHPASHDPALLARAPWRRVDLAGSRNVSVVGAGNVALDVARLILRAPTALDPSNPSTSSGAKGLAALRTSDIPEPVLEHLSRARVEHVGIFARRGAAQLACTTKELREMLALPGARFRSIAEHDLAVAREDLAALEAAAASDPERSTEARVRKRMLALLEKSSKEAKSAGQDAPSWAFNFFHRPQELRPASSDVARVGSALWQVGKSSAAVETPADTVVSSVGYLGAPLAGSAPADSGDAEMPWDASRGVVPNEGGRVRGMPGMYVSGWLARGPVGVIASTMYDANSVADLLLADWAAQSERSPAAKGMLADVPEPLAGLPAELRAPTRPVVSWQGWERLDREELRRGKELGKLREKVLSVEEMLQIAA